MNLTNTWIIKFLIGTEYNTLISLFITDKTFERGSKIHTKREAMRQTSRTGYVCFKTTQIELEITLETSLSVLINGSIETMIFLTNSSHGRQT